MNSFPLRPLLLLLIIVLGTLPLQAHVDTVIKRTGTTLTGLPETYGPAEFDAKTARLRIGKREMTLTPLLKSICDQPHELEMTASWYHEGKLPPYITLQISPKGKDFSYRLLFNLNTLELIDLSVKLQESKSSYRQLSVALADEERKSIKASVKVLK